MSETITTNAIHPLEIVIVEEISDRLHSVKFPLGRIHVSIVFKEASSKPYTNSTKFSYRQGLVIGDVSININPLAVIQNPKLMGDTLASHEVAHILAQTESFKSGSKIKEHGPEWMKWMVKLSGDILPKTSHDSEFDLRASVLSGGGVLSGCGCDPQVGGVAISLKSKTKLEELRTGKLECDACGITLKVLDESEIPSQLVSNQQYLHELTGKRPPIRAVNAAE